MKIHIVIFVICGHLLSVTKAAFQTYDSLNDVNYFNDYKKTPAMENDANGFEEFEDEFSLDEAMNDDAVPESERCGRVVDIGFIIDSSGSLRKNYKKELKFVSAIARRFKISRNGAHAGVVVFSDSGKWTKLTIKLNKYTNTQKFVKAVMKSPFYGFRTRIDLGFKVAEEQLFTTSGGARPNMKRIIFLITDGKQNPTKSIRGVPYDPVKASKALHDSGVSIFAVGIGKYVNHAQLKAITRSRDKVYYANDLDVLTSKKFVRQASKMLCQGGKLEEEEVKQEEKCDYSVDVGFLVDSSGSIKDEYQKELFFAGRIASRFDIKEGGAHAGLVVFSDKNYVKTHIKMNQFYSSAEFNEAVKTTPFFGYRTRIDLAFQVTEKELFSVSNGARPNMKKVIFLITDGKQNPVKDDDGSSLDPVAASKSLYDDGVLIFAVGIGDAVDHDQLNAITRDPNRVYYAKTLDQLISDEFVKDVSKKVCTAGHLNPTDCCCKSGPININVFNMGKGTEVSPASANGHDLSGTSQKELVQMIRDNFERHQAFNEAVQELVRRSAGKKG